MLSPTVIICTVGQSQYWPNCNQQFKKLSKLTFIHSVTPNCCCPSTITADRSDHPLLHTLRFNFLSKHPSPSSISNGLCRSLWLDVLRSEPRICVALYASGGHTKTALHLAKTNVLQCAVVLFMLSYHLFFPNPALPTRWSTLFPRQVRHLRPLRVLARRHQPKLTPASDAQGPAAAHRPYQFSKERLQSSWPWPGRRVSGT